MKEEIWKPITGFNRKYFISECGNIKKYIGVDKDNKVKKYLYMSSNKNRKGYLMIGLTKNKIRYRFSVHSLVVREFIGIRKYNLQVNHKDGNKLNNHYSNLEYITCFENIRHAINNNLRNYVNGERCGSSKLRENQVLEIRAMYSKGNITQKKLSEIYKVSQGAIRFIIIKRNWKHLKMEKNRVRSSNN